MNELNELDFHKSLDFVNPVQKMINFIVAALIFSSFHLDFLFFSTLGNVISALLFFLGLRLVKNANKAFYYAYCVSVFYLMLSIIEMMLLTTPFRIPEVINIMISFLAIARVFLVCGGLKLYLKKKTLATKIARIYVVLYGFGVLGMFLPDIALVFIVLYIIFFVLMIKALLACEKDILDNGYTLTLSPIRIGTAKFVIGYIIVTLIIMLGCHFIYPFVVARPQNVQRPDYSEYALVGEYHDEITSLKVYDCDEIHYLYAYQIQTPYITKPIKSLELKIYHHLTLERYYGITDIIITDGTDDYVSELVVDNNNFFIPFSFNQERYSYVSYLKPNFHKNYTIQFAIIAEKGVNDNDPDDREKMVFHGWAYDDINICYSYYDKDLLLYMDGYSKKQRIIVSMEDGQVEDISYNEEE